MAARIHKYFGMLNKTQKRKVLEKHAVEFSTKKSSCHKCGGSGIYSSYHGYCFRCSGCGTDPSHTYFVFELSEEKSLVVNADLEKRSEKAVLRKIKKEEKFKAKKLAFYENSPAMKIYRENEKSSKFCKYLPVFAHDIASKGEKYLKLSEKQEAALLKVCESTLEKFANWAEANADAADAPEGRLEITGTVMSTKEYFNDYGSVYKMLIKADAGYKVFVSIPKGISADIKGRKITFTARLTPSATDPKFAKGSRPSKATLHEEKEIANAE